MNGQRSWFRTRSRVSAILVFVLALTTTWLSGCKKKNEPPNTPSTPTGPTKAQTDSACTFNSAASDPDGDKVAVRFNWGDGGLSDWSGLVAGGTEVSDAHGYASGGAYFVSAQAKDEHDTCSAWSGTTLIRMSSALPPPLVPSGPSSGSTGAHCTFQTSASDTLGSAVAVRFAWGDGDTSDWSSLVPNHSAVQEAHSYSTAGFYAVTAQARDVNGLTSAWSDSASITIADGGNNPPNTPTTPSGPDSGQVGASYDFSSSASDPDGDSVKYCFDWGDGTEDWSGFASSGTQVQVSHPWSTADTYNVTVMAQDIHGANSGWSSAHSIAISGGSSGFPSRVVATIPVGTAPRDVAALPNGDYVYVTNNGPNNVSVIRTSDYMVVATIPVGPDPWGVAALPNSDYVYVANETSHDVSVIRTSDSTVVATVPVGDYPNGVAALPSGNHVYVSNVIDNNVSVIRTSDYTVVATIPVGTWPNGMAALPSGNYVYVANNGTDTVSVIRTSDNTVVATIPVGTWPRGVAALPNGNYVYVSNNGTDTVSVIRTSDRTVVATIPVGPDPWGVAALPDGDYVYVTNNGANNVSVIRTSDYTVVATIPVGAHPCGVAALPNGNYVYVVNCQDGSVSVIGY